MRDFVEVAEAAARAGGDQLIHWMGRFEAREKAPADFVTQADFASQDAILKILTQAFPEHGFIGEESPRERSSQPGYCWIVDPLDGTLNYVHQLRHFCVSIALEHQGRVVAGVIFDPLSGECYRAARGQGAFLNDQPIRARETMELSNALVAVSFPTRVEREAPQIRDFVELSIRCRSMRRMGSSALNLAYVAAGRFDAFLAQDTKSWDVAAGMLLVEEAGGHVTGPAGEPFDLQRASILATANPKLHGKLLEVLGK